MGQLCRSVPWGDLSRAAPSRELSPLPRRACLGDFSPVPLSGGSGPSLLACLPVVGYICHFFIPGARSALAIFCCDCCHLSVLPVPVAWSSPLGCVFTEVIFPSVRNAAAPYLCSAHINLLADILHPCQALSYINSPS